MTHRYLLAAMAVGMLIAFAAVSTVAQVGELRGTVMMQQADGSKVPLADATIDVFRTDIKGDYHTKTNKKGEFVFAGLPFVGEYTIVASHPTAKPNFISKFKVGRQIPAEITVTPGDGKKLTLEDTKSMAPSGPAGGSGGSAPSSESAADRAKREELARKNAEIEAGNKKITESNEVVNRTFKAGNEALTAASAASKSKNFTEAIQRYTDAIAQYDQGLAADAEQPALLTNKAVALKGRAIDRYNSTITSQMEDAAKTAALEGARGDFRAAAESSGKAVTLLKAQPTPTDPTELDRQNKNKYAALITHAEAMRLFVTKVDGSKADEGITAFQEYIAIETDPAKKKQAQIDSAQMLLDSGAADKAFTQFQALVTEQPDNPDANLGAGLALFATGDKTKFQDAANYLQHYVDVAPDTHKYKADAKAILTELKNTEKVVPEKTAPQRKRRP
ncbi:MAG TPA: carboxypeptidase-like regulatory domain-containing protein [Pyrinomonadaceae bacterium]